MAPTREAFAWVEELWQDLRCGVRMPRKNLGFEVIVALAPALGIGANTAIFSLIDAVLLSAAPHALKPQASLCAGKQTAPASKRD